MCFVGSLPMLILFSTIDLRNSLSEKVVNHNSEKRVLDLIVSETPGTEPY